MFYKVCDTHIDLHFKIYNCNILKKYFVHSYERSMASGRFRCGCFGVYGAEATCKTLLHIRFVNKIRNRLLS